MESVKLASLTRDPRNARGHDDRNIDTVATLMLEVGTGRSIVINEDGMILAGEASARAAATIGIDDVRVIDVDGDALVALRRNGLTDEQQVKLAIGDNRAAELAHWKTDALINLNQTIQLADVFRRDELEKLVKADHASIRLADPSATTDATHRSLLLQSQSINAVHLTDMARAQAVLGDAYDPNAHYVELTCYHCGETFFVNRKDIIGK